MNSQEAITFPLAQQGWPITTEFFVNVNCAGHFFLQNLLDVLNLQRKSRCNETEKKKPTGTPLGFMLSKRSINRADKKEARAESAIPGSGLQLALSLVASSVAVSKLSMDPSVS